MTARTKTARTFHQPKLLRVFEREPDEYPGMTWEMLTGTYTPRVRVKGGNSQTHTGMEKALVANGYKHGRDWWWTNTDSSGYGGYSMQSCTVRGWKLKPELFRDLVRLAKQHDAKLEVYHSPGHVNWLGWPAYHFVFSWEGWQKSHLPFSYRTPAAFTNSVEFNNRPRKPRGYPRVTGVES